MKKYIITLSLLLFAVCGYSIDAIKTYGKSGFRWTEYDNIVGTAMDSVVCTTAVDAEYEIRVLSVGGSGYRCQYRNIDTGVNTEHYVTPSMVDSVNMDDFYIYFSAGIDVGDRFTFSRSYYIPVKVDSLGGVYNAFFSYMKNDSVSTVSSTPDTVLLTGSYDKGLLLFATENIKFRTNTMTGWMFLTNYTSMYVPILISPNDTLFVRSASTIPDVTISRGR